MDKQVLYNFIYEQYDFDAQRKYDWLSTVDRSSSIEEFLAEILEVEKTHGQRILDWRIEELESENNNLSGDLSELRYTNEDLCKEAQELRKQKKELLEDIEKSAPSREILRRMEEVERSCNRRIEAIEKEKEDLRIQLEVADKAHHAYLEAKLHF